MVSALVFILWVVCIRDHVATTVAVEPIYQGDEDVKAMALTCNVFWGEEYIGRMLEILEEKNVQMTFFVGGTWAEKFPDLVKKYMTRVMKLAATVTPTHIPTIYQGRRTCWI